VDTRSCQRCLSDGFANEDFQMKSHLKRKGKLVVDF